MARIPVNGYAVFHDVGGTTTLQLYYTGGVAKLDNLSYTEAGFMIDLLRHEKSVGYDPDQKRFSTIDIVPVGQEA